jgi:hypothetical protein
METITVELVCLLRTNPSPGSSSMTYVFYSPGPHGSPGLHLGSQAANGWLALHKFQWNLSLPTWALGKDRQTRVEVSSLVFLTFVFAELTFTYLHLLNSGFTWKHWTAI